MSDKKKLILSIILFGSIWLGGWHRHRRHSPMSVPLINPFRLSAWVMYLLQLGSNRHNGGSSGAISN